MRALVTGHAGFIGSHLCEHLLCRGWTVVGMDDYSAGHSSNYDTFSRHIEFFPFLQDITDKDGLERRFHYMKTLDLLPDVIFHNAASKKVVCMDNPGRDLMVNAGGTLNLLQMAVKYGVKKFVHASTGSVYGEQQPGCAMTEQHPLKPISFYGVSKLAGERYVDVFNMEYGLDTAILRYFHVYGPRQDWRYDMEKRLGYVIPIFIQQIVAGKNIIIHGDGEQQRSLTSVHDVVRANEFVAMHHTNGQVYNCASGLRITINQLAEDIFKIMQKKNLYILHDKQAFGDPQKFDVVNNKLRNEGFRFEFATMEKYRQELRATVEWYVSELGL